MTNSFDFVVSKEQSDDADGIRAVNLAAFPGGGEADLVDQLRSVSPVYLSYVAKVGENIVGHLLFTPVCIHLSKGDSIEGLGLGPMAALPEFQNKGIGSALIVEAMQDIKEKGTPFVVVLGHPNFYPKFGFMPASRFGVSCAYPDIPDEVFMIYVFDQERMQGVRGTAKYRPEFDTVT